MMKKKQQHLIYLQKGVALFLLLLCFSLTNYSQVTHQKDTSKMFIDNDDGAIDLSKFLDSPHGFVPFPIIITQPAVGYGGGLGILFIKDKKKKSLKRQMPVIAGVAGAGTQNKTWLVGAFYFNTWKDDKIRYVGVAAKTYVNMTYYGNNSKLFEKYPVKFNMDAWFLMQRLQFRIKETNLFIGAQYTFYDTKNSIDTLPDKPLINKLIRKLDTKSTVSMLTLIVNYDSRNNIFSANKGMNTGFQLSYNSKLIGGSVDYLRGNIYYTGYFPITKKIYSGWRYDYKFSIGSVPFYAEPFINMRGAPAMKYQSDNAMLVETEWMFNVYKRWSIDIFGGAANAFKTYDTFTDARSVYTYGFGFRYKIASKYGILTGIDFAWSNNDDFAFYLIFGSPWRN